MKTNKICESGVIGQDGRLRIPMDRVNQWCAEHKGERLVVRFEAAAHQSTEAQIAYYLNYIVPTIQVALLETGERKTEKQVDLWLRQQCGSCYNDYGGLLEVREISKQDFSDFIDWIKQFAAEHLFVYVEDSKTI